MEVLHVWNTAGVPSVLSKYQRRLLKWNSRVIVREDLDLFGYRNIYGEYLVVKRSKYRFLLSMFFIARNSDLIHIHSLDKIAPVARMLYGRRKKIVIHYHGTIIRKKWRERERFYKHADLIIVSTPDLLEDVPEPYVGRVDYLPNPVDTELFRPLSLPRKEKALLIIKYGRKHRWKDIRIVAEDLSKRYGIDYETIFVDNRPIPHHEMPRVLNRYKYFFDIHHGFHDYEKIIPTLSKTALEALACGTIVISPFIGVVKELPPMHKPENVIRKLVEILVKHDIVGL